MEGAILSPADIDPLRKAGEAARRAFFGMPNPANDAEMEEERGSREDAKRLMRGEGAALSSCFGATRAA